MSLSIFKKLAAKDIILATLLILLIPSALFVGWEKVILQTVICAFVTISLDLGINFLKKTKYFFPKAGLLTGLIVALVLPIGVNPLIAAFAALVAIFSKQFIKIGRNHIFNPATFGLVVAAVLFKIPLGWWGDNLIWLTIPLGMLAVLQARKELQVIGFVATYVLIEYLFIKLYIPNDITALKTAFETNSWFFALFMVPEPMTSLLPYRLSPIFGFIAASAGINLSLIKFTPISNNSLLLGLLVANAVAFIYLFLQRREAKGH